MVKDDADAVYPLISGLIGTGEAVEFKAWCRVYGQLPSMEAVFGGTAESVPRDADIMYALVCSMTAYASDHRYDTVGIGHSLDYAKGFPADFGELLIRNYCAFDKDYEDFLRTVPEYAEYGRRRGGARNGNVWK